MPQPRYRQVSVDDTPYYHCISRCVRRAFLCGSECVDEWTDEEVARMANSEDHCTGSFWEGRFKSQTLLDERTLLACMAYVDLNPIRAAIAATPETSDYTSVQERIEYPDNGALAPFSGQGNDIIPFNLKDYLELVSLAEVMAVRNGSLDQWVRLTLGLGTGAVLVLCVLAVAPPQYGR